MRKSLGPAAAAFGSFGFFWGIWAISTADVERELGLSHRGLGILVALALIGATVAITLGGPLAERIGTSRALSLWMGLWGVFLLALTEASSIGWFVPLYVGAVTTGAGMDVTMNVAATAGLAHRPAALMRFHGLFNIGAILGAGTTAAALYCGLTWRVALVPLGIASLCGSIWARRSELPAGGAGERHSMLHSLRLLKATGLLVVGAVATLGAMVDGGIETFGVLYLRTQLHTGVVVGASAYVIGHLLAGGTRLGLADLATRPRGLRPVGIGMVVSALGLGLELGVDHSVAAAAGLALAAIGATVVWPVLFSYAGERSPRPAVAVSGITAMGYLGFLVGPPLVGSVAGASGLRAGLGLLALTALTAATLAIATTRPSRRSAD